MKHYELILLVSPNISSEEIKSFQGKMENFIQEEGGVLVSAKSATGAIKKSLPSPIKTKLHPAAEAAYFISLNFDLIPEKLDNFEKNLKSDRQILRYSILNKKPLKPAVLRRMSPKMFADDKPSSEKTGKSPQEEIGLEKIDEKLDEILGKF